MCESRWNDRPVRKFILEALELVQHGFQWPVTDKLNVLPSNHLKQSLDAVAEDAVANLLLTSGRRAVLWIGVIHTDKCMWSSLQVSWNANQERHLSYSKCLLASKPEEYGAQAYLTVI